MSRFIVLFLFLFTACIPETEHLSPSEEERVDTLYANRVEKWRPILDSLCLIREDSMVSHAVDSLLEIRKKEMEEILNR